MKRWWNNFLNFFRIFLTSYNVNNYVQSYLNHKNLAWLTEFPLESWLVEALGGPKFWQGRPRYNYFKGLLLYVLISLIRIISILLKYNKIFISNLKMRYSINLSVIIYERNRCDLFASLVNIFLWKSLPSYFWRFSDIFRSTFYSDILIQREFRKFSKKLQLFAFICSFSYLYS